LEGAVEAVEAAAARAAPAAATEAPLGAADAAAADVTEDVAREVVGEGALTQITTRLSWAAQRVFQPFADAPAPSDADGHAHTAELGARGPLLDA